MESKQELLEQINKSDLMYIIKTDESFIEGTSNIKEYISTAKKQGIGKLLLADRNSLAAMVDFITECKKEKIKPILGATLSIDFPLIDNHFLLFSNLESINNVEKLFGFKIFDFFNQNNNIRIDLIAELIKSGEKYKKSKSKTRSSIFINEISETIEKASEGTYILNNLINMDKDKIEKDFLIEFINGNNFSVVDLAEQLVTFKVDNKLKRSDLVVSAMNDKGLQNLKDLISLAFLNGQQDVKTDTNGKRDVDSYPYISIDTLKKYSEGICFYLGDRRDALGRDIIEVGRTGIDIINLYKEILGDSIILFTKKSTDNDHPIYVENEIKINKQVLELSLTENIPCIATHDARFADKDMYELHDIKRAILLGEEVHSVIREKEEYKNQYLINPEELIENFKNYPELLINNAYISDIPQYKIKLNKSILPEFPIPEDFQKNILNKILNDKKITFDNNSDKEFLLRTLVEKEVKEKFPEDEWEYEYINQYNNLIAGEYMDSLTWNGIEKKMALRMNKEEWDKKRPEYYERFLYESGIIKNMGFPGYFLIVQDFINWAKNKGVPVGTGRGSGAGSLVAFGLNITGLDPVKDGLLFERFLNPERVSMPDFDIDFGEGFDELGNIVNRDTVIEYVKHFYTKDPLFPSVSQIATRGEFGLKSGMKAIAKTLGHTIDFEKDLVVAVPETPDFSFDAFLEIPEIQERYNNEAEFRLIVNLAKKLDGKKQSSGVHAGGVVIAPNSITQFCPVQCSPNGEGLVTQLTKNPVEYAGLVKFDFLGLKTLSVIELCLKNVKERKAQNIDILSIPEDDYNTFHMLQEGKTNSVFQVESSGMTSLMKQLQVEDIPAISDLLALYRPGPMESGMLENFKDVRTEILNQRHKVDPKIKDIKSVRMDLISSDLLESFTPLHNDLLSILSPTNNQMIYQEQVMQAAQILADYSLGGADLLRRAMGKKKPEEMAQQKQIFIKGSLNKYREHFIEITQKTLGQAIDIDFTKEADKLNIQKYLDQHNGFYYIIEHSKVLSLFKDYIGYSEEDYINIHKNINNLKVKTFQIEHSKKIMDLLNKKFTQEGMSPLESDHMSKKIYFSLAQFVRFNYIFSAIEKFAAYGFNKSHSLAYANITYQTAYLKANYTPEFFSAVLTFQQDSLEKINITAVDMKLNHGIQLLCPDVNKNKFNFYPQDEKSIMYGLAGIKSLGNSGFIIYKEREINGEFLSIEDLVYRFSYRAIEMGNHTNKLNVGAFSALAFSGALDNLIPNYVKNCQEINSKRHYIVKFFEKIQENIPSKREDFIPFIKENVEFRLKNGYYSSNIVFVPDNNKQPLYQVLDVFFAYSKNSDVAWKTEPIIELGKGGKPKKPKAQLIKFSDNLYEKVASISEYYSNVDVKKHIDKIFLDFKDDIIKETNVDKILVLGKEKEYTGLYLSEHPVNINNIKARSFVNSNVKNLENIVNITEEKKGNTVTIIGVINKIEEFMIKNGNDAGKNMCKFSLEDDTSEINITLFNKQFILVEDLLTQNTVVKITGEITYSENYGLSIKPNSFQSLLPNSNEIFLQDQNKFSGKKKYKI